MQVLQLANRRDRLSQSPNYILLTGGSKAYLLSVARFLSPFRPSYPRPGSHQLQQTEDQGAVLLAQLLSMALDVLGEALGSLRDVSQAALCAHMFSTR